MSIGDQKTSLGRCDSEGLHQARQVWHKNGTALVREICVAPRKLMVHFCTLAFWLPTRVVSLRLPAPRQYGASHR
jgi:hypothetical protein